MYKRIRTIDFLVRKSGKGIGGSYSLWVWVAKDLPGDQGKWTERAGVSACPTSNSSYSCARVD